ncbi:MAG TPA: outer membrane beta-barrel protein [Aestuariivirga sp.]
MRILFKLSVAILALMPVAQAVAADAPPVVQLRPAQYDWSGVYAGGWVGLACLDGRGSLVDNTAGRTFGNGGCGFKGGALMGYNYQFDQFVVGAEADLGTSTDIVRNTEPTADFRFNMNYLATVRGRAGWAMDNTLFYLTAGGAFAQGELNGIVAATPSHLTANQFGWTVGAGMEHAVSDHFRVRMEYLYTQFANTKYQDACCNVDWNWGGEHEVKAAAIWAF